MLKTVQVDGVDKNFIVGDSSDRWGIKLNNLSEVRSELNVDGRSSAADSLYFTLQSAPYALRKEEW